MYLAWQAERLKSVFSFLASCTPVPDLIVFPETSIPLWLLHIAKEFAAEHGGTVFASTHSYQRTRESSAVYTVVSRKTSHFWGCACSPHAGGTGLTKAPPAHSLSAGKQPSDSPTGGALCKLIVCGRSGKPWCSASPAASPPRSAAAASSSGSPAWP